jgi:hypothetical protein
MLELLGRPFGDPELARGLRVSDPGISCPQLQVLVLPRGQPDFPATPEKSFALVFGERRELTLWGLRMLPPVSASEVLVNEIDEIRRTRCLLPPPVRLFLQRVAKARSTLYGGVRVEILPCQESRFYELVLPARAFQGRLRCRVALR